MATYDNIRLAVAHLTRTLTLYKENIEIIAEDTLLVAGDAAAKAMAATILSSTTATGEERAAVKGGAGEAGRYKTGDMFQSVYDDTFSENVGGAHVLTKQENGNTVDIGIKVGFLNSPAYTKYQELGTSKGIVPMMAVQAGFLAARAVIFQDLIFAARQAGNDALADRLTKRGERPL